MTTARRKRPGRSPNRKLWLQALIQRAPDLITLFDGDRIARYVSPSAARITGYDHEELLGKPFSDFVHPDDVDAAYRAFESMVGTHRARAVETRFRRKDGSWVVLESMAVGVPALQGVLVSSRDITPHVRVEAALRRSAQESARLFEDAPCGYHSVDRSGVFRMVNNTELGWLQRSREELVGRMTFAELVSPASRPAHERYFAELKRKGVVHDGELELVRKDGTVFPVLGQAIAIRGASGAFAESRTTLFDISERRNAERDLRKVNRALEVLSESRAQIIHARSESRVLDGICRTLVEVGGYRLVAVHLAEAGGGWRLAATAHAADGGWDRLTVPSTERELRSLAAAASTTAPTVHHDVRTDPQLAPWYKLAVRARLGSLASLPLKDPTGALGALSIFSAETDVFHADELQVLEELAQDLAFVVGSLRAHQAALPAFSPREREVLKLVAEGRSTRGIAAALGVAPASVSTYRARLMVKLGVRNVAGLVRIAVSRGIVTM